MTMTAGRQTGKSLYRDIAKMLQDLNSPPQLTDLEFEETRVHGAVYHTVKPIGGYWPDMEQWCKETFGEPGDVWPTQDFAWPEAPRWMQNNRKFWFRNTKDRDWFIMRWRA